MQEADSPPQVRLLHRQKCLRFGSQLSAGWGQRRVLAVEAFVVVQMYLSATTTGPFRVRSPRETLRLRSPFPRSSQGSPKRRFRQIHPASRTICQTSGLRGFFFLLLCVPNTQTAALSVGRLCHRRGCVKPSTAAVCRGSGLL